MQIFLECESIGPFSNLFFTLYGYLNWIEFIFNWFYTLFAPSKIACKDTARCFRLLKSRGFAISSRSAKTMHSAANAEFFCSVFCLGRHEKYFPWSWCCCCFTLRFIIHHKNNQIFSQTLFCLRAWYWYCRKRSNTTENRNLGFADTLRSLFCCCWKIAVKMTAQ